MVKNSTIMVADDDPAILEAVQLLLTDEGYTVHLAGEGRTFEDICHYLPDLVLLDIWMSGEDGREIAKQLKKEPRTKDIPIILFSATKSINTSAHDSGAEDFLAKPFEIKDLLEIVEKYTTQPLLH